VADLTAHGAPAAALPHAREVAGEIWLARVLRVGAIASGALFLASMVLEPVAPEGSALLGKLAASALIATPVARLVAAGTMLGLRGERRYALLTVAVLLLLALAVLSGVSA